MVDPEIVESAIADALIELQPSADALDTARAALAVDLRRVEEEQRRYAAAIAAGGDVPVLAQALQDRESVSASRSCKRSQLWIARGERVHSTCTG